ncbi:BQ5605_C001g00917 [Microbotryum silenes-dioicae]|uniref:BQ5605_C001g00917 protein n=1 Tax=Microbotryum silenes-dioicae TaxID=796604 RepID=A0A2X0M8N1_9BASI|nr:BQ5605_C001g00917 [Microbotryum silenes-dioicae]
MTYTATLDSYLPPFQDLLAALQQLSSQLVAARLDSSSSSNTTATDEGSTLNIGLTTQEAGPLFAALHAWNRKGLGEIAALRDETMDARIKMEEAYLRLQNLMFEKDHLQREILACQLYESEYQHLPLIPEDEFLALAQSPQQQPEEVVQLLQEWTRKNPSHSDPSTALKAALIDDPHQLMLTRLQNEHNERKRLDRDKKELSAVKAALVKENERKKARLDQLEQRLELFVKSAKTIQTTMHGDESMAVVSSYKLGQDETSASTGTRDDGEPTSKGAEQDDPTTVAEEGMVVDEP